MGDIEKLSKQAEELITELYASVNDLQDKFDKINNEIVELLNDPDIKDLCNAPETIQRMSDIITEISSITDDISKILQTISEHAELMVTSAMEIILKAIEMIKLKCKILTVKMKKELAKFTKDELTRLLDGEGTAAVVTISAPIALKAATAQVISKIVTILDMVVSVLSAIPVLGLEGGAMVFLPTPKSILKVVDTVKMTIVNYSGSLANSLGALIEPQIATAAESLNSAMVSERTANIAAAAAQGSTSVLSSSGIIVPPISFTKIDADSIMKLVNNALALLSIGSAEPLPRYEKLKITNLRYMLFLITGFVPAGYQTFGIPNYP